jgi:enoyl-CoA hydratase
MAYETINVTIEDRIALIKLDRPEAMNALNGQLLRELAAAVALADSNEKGALHRSDGFRQSICGWR